MEEKTYEQFLQEVKGEKAYFTNIKIKMGGQTASLKGLAKGKGIGAALSRTDAKQVTSLGKYPLMADIQHRLTAEKQRLQRSFLTCISKDRWIVWECDRQRYLEQYFAIKAKCEEYRQELLDGYDEAFEEFSSKVRCLVTGAFYDELLSQIGQAEMDNRIAQAASALGEPVGDLHYGLIEKVVEMAGRMGAVDGQVAQYEQQFVTREQIEHKFGVSIESPVEVPSPAAVPANDTLQQQAVQEELADLQGEAVEKMESMLLRMHDRTQEFIARTRKPSDGDIASILGEYMSLRKQAASITQSLGVQLQNIESAVAEMESEVKGKVLGGAIEVKVKPEGTEDITPMEVVEDEPAEKPTPIKPIPQTKALPKVEKVVEKVVEVEVEDMPAREVVGVSAGSAPMVDVLDDVTEF